MRFAKILRALKQKIFGAALLSKVPSPELLPQPLPKSTPVPTSTPNSTIKANVGSLNSTMSAYGYRMRAQCDQISELRDLLSRDRNFDIVSRIHPSLAVNLAATLQRASYIELFKRAKALIIDIGNYPQHLGGPAFGTDFVFFELWTRSDSCTLSHCPQNLSKWQPFIDLVCVSAEVLSNPAVSLASGKLSQDMALLAQVALRDTGWDEPATAAYMEASAITVVQQLRTLIDIVLPEVFSSDEP